MSDETAMEPAVTASEWERYPNGLPREVWWAIAERPAARLAFANYELEVNGDPRALTWAMVEGLRRAAEQLDDRILSPALLDYADAIAALLKPRP